MTAPATRVTGEIWYDPNITSPGGTSGGNTDTGKQVTVHQYSTNEVAMYDGSTHVATFTADNTVDKIILDDKSIKIPNGVILGNMNGSDSINLEKNSLNNSVGFSVKDQYIKDIADNRTALALVPVSNRITNIEEDIVSKYSTLDNAIKNNSYLITTNTEELNNKIDQTASDLLNRIGYSDENINNLGNRIDGESTRITNLNKQITNLGTVKDEILNRLDEIDGEDGAISSIEIRLNTIDGDETTSLKSRVEKLNESLTVLSTALSSISTDIASIKATINSIHGEGTI